MNYLKLLPKTVAALSLLTLLSCQEEEPLVSNQRDVVITNDADVLSNRINLKEEPIAIIPENSSSRVSSDNITLKLKGELTIPTADGKSLHATSIAQNGGFFVVSYNFPGAEYGGAIDLLNTDLELKSQIVFGDADISDVSFLNDDLYFVGGTSSLEESAFVERIKVNLGQSSFSLDNQVRTSVGNYVATGVTAANNEVFVTTGDDVDFGGGLYQMSNSLDELSYQEIADARWVEYADDQVFVASGEPDMISVWAQDKMEKSFEFQHNGATTAGAKMTIDVADGWVFVAGGYEGLLVYDLDGNFKSKHTFGDESFTNAVTAENGKVFISNGLGGVYVATYDPFLNIVGKLDLGSSESVNHIDLHDDMLYVASGSGGVKMIEVK